MTIKELIEQAESGLTAQFARIARMEEIGTRRVLDAFREHQVAYRHFAPTTGYGYDDVGRDTLERIFAELFGTQAAIVRPQIASGTHAISLCLFGLVLPGDDIVSATGMPYDTLQDIIGWGEGDAPVGSLREMGVSFHPVALRGGKIDLDAVENAITPKTKLVIEIKDQGDVTKNERIVDAIVAELQNRQMVDKIDLISFNYTVCQRFAKALPSVTVGYLSGDKAPSTIDPAIKCIDYSYGTLRSNPKWIQEAHDLGMKVNVWTVNSTTDMLDFIVQGVDYITTDYPATLKEMLEKLAE